MELRSLCLRVAMAVGVLALCGTRGTLEHYNNDLESEENLTGVLPDTEHISVHSERIQTSERVQYKTAEIADAMQSSDIQTDPALLLSMVPKGLREKVAKEVSNAVCDPDEDGGECGTDLKSTAGDQTKTKMENNEANVSTSEQVTTDESNATDSGKPLKVNCDERNITGVANFTVQILNVSQDLMELLSPNSSECTMVLFFTTWCHFSASLAPHFNALPRAFPTLHFLALDASQHSSLSTRFGTVAVPNILLFQGAKPMARFNHTERTLESFKSFIFNQSGIEAKPDIVVTEADHEGPLPSTRQTGIDWLLVFSIVYVTAFIIYATMQSDRICWLVPGQEQEHQHQE